MQTMVVTICIPKTWPLSCQNTINITPTGGVNIRTILCTICLLLLYMSGCSLPIAIVSSSLLVIKTEHDMCQLSKELDGEYTGGAKFIRADGTVVPEP